jgi:hypothetical protein
MEVPPRCELAPASISLAKVALLAVELVPRGWCSPMIRSRSRRSI